MSSNRVVNVASIVGYDALRLRDMARVRRGDRRCYCRLRSETRIQTVGLKYYIPLELRIGREAEEFGDGWGVFLLHGQTVARRYYENRVATHYSRLGIIGMDIRTGIWKGFNLTGTITHPVDQIE